MRTLIFSAAFSLSMALLVPTAYATGVSGNANAPHITHSGAHPRDARVQNATHHFELHVEGNQLEQLTVDLPKGIEVSNDIVVTNQSGQKVDAAVSVSDRKATIAFAQPVSPGTTLSISLQGVRTPGLSNTWHYSVYGKSAGMTGIVPLGLVRIQTDSPG